MNRFRTTPMEQSPLAHRHPSAGGSRIAYMNVALAAISLFMLFYYVVQSNDVAVQVWHSRDTQERLTILRDNRNALVARQSALDDRQQLIALAQDAGMVPAVGVVYLVQPLPVAAR